MKKIILSVFFVMCFSTVSYAMVTFRVTPSYITLPDAGEKVSITVSVEDAENVGAYQLDIVFPATQMKVDSSSDISVSSFLEKTDRTAVSLGPKIDNESGVISLGEFSYGSGTGANGDADLVTVEFTVLSSGATSTVSSQDNASVALDNIEVVDVEGNSISSEAEVPTVSETGIALLCLSIVGLAYVYLRRRPLFTTNS